jgi:DNA-binding LacI/PurR family transcriptional regulator
MSAIEEAGMRVPEEVSVVGSDDVYFARLARPSLTTVRIPRDQLGKLAFKALEEMLRSKNQKGVEFVVETELIIRNSTGPSRREGGI